MGAGILGVPLFFKSYGIILGILLIIFFACVTVYSVNCLLYCNKISNRSGYSMFAKISYGNFGNLLVKVVIIVNNFGLCCAYFRIFGNVASGVVQAFLTDEQQDNFFGHNWRNWFYICIVGVMMSFFIFREKIDALKVSQYILFLCHIIYPHILFI